MEIHKGIGNRNDNNYLNQFITYENNQILHGSNGCLSADSKSCLMRER